MTDAFKDCEETLRSNPQPWLVTGGAGFIGSNLIEHLLSLDQEVTCFDNFSTGHLKNLDAVRSAVSEKQEGRLRLIEGDLANPDDCAKATAGVSYVLHHGAQVSVPLSIENPTLNHQSNVTGTHNLFLAAKEAGVRRIVYASSSAVYGSEPGLPKKEETPGNLLSPYAASKAIAEQYANAFAEAYGMSFAGLRYFNVFGQRQDPAGAYGAVIPVWVRAMLEGKTIFINGDGETTRDFIHVNDVVRANLLAATSPSDAGSNRVFNIALGEKTSLNTLFENIRSALQKIRPEAEIPDPVYRDFRAGDVRHSWADFSRAQEELGFEPAYTLAEGLGITMEWYADQVG